MSATSRTSPEAVALRETAAAWGENLKRPVWTADERESLACWERLASAVRAFEDGGRAPDEGVDPMMATRLRWVDGRFNTSEARVGTFRLTVSYASTQSRETGKSRTSG